MSIIDWQRVLAERDEQIAELLEVIEAQRVQIQEIAAARDEAARERDAILSAARKAVIDEPEFPTPITSEEAEPFLVELRKPTGHRALQALAQVIVAATKEGILKRMDAK